MPTKTELHKLPGTEQARLIREKEISPVEIIDATFARIHELNPKLNAFCVLDEENAKEAAKKAEEDVMSGKELGPLHGVPVSIKDLICTKGIRTTFGSKIYENYIPEEDDIVVERLKKAGAIITGKTNVPEFGYQGVTDNKIFGPSHNPWNTELTPGGSSGGSAAAVASGMGSLTLGSDGGGSVRIPASLCGLYGMKASMGRVPLYPGCRDPKYPGGSSWESLEHIGPMTRTVEDNALLLSVIAGPHHMDRYSLPDDGINYLDAINNTDIKGLNIAFSPDFGYITVDSEVRSITANAAKMFEQLGCNVTEANPGFKATESDFWTLVARDTDLVGLRELSETYELGPTLKSFIETNWTAEQFTNAYILRQEVNQKMAKFMEKYDLIITPTLAIPAFDIGINGPNEIDGREVDEGHWLSFLNPLNMTGQPAASIPAGFTSEGLPIGLQIIGRHLDDHLVLKASAAFEKAQPWAHHWPKN